MTAPLAPLAGSELAHSPAVSQLPEGPMTVIRQSHRLLSAWQPSERRRLGLLSLRSYEQAGMFCPTDVWTYQRLFIDQQRDASNPWAAKKPAR